MKYTKLLWIALFLLSLAYNFPLIKKKVVVYDEGLILVGAERVLNGELPYKDFWSLYPPGQFYTIAVLFKLFGASIFTERIYDIATKAILSISIFLINKKMGLSNKMASFSWGMSVIWAFFSGQSAYPVFTAILFIFIGVYFCLHYLDTGKIRWLIYSAFLVALSAMFRHDLAGMAAAAILIGILIRIPKDTGSRWYPALYYICTVVISGLLFSSCLINAVGLRTIADQLIWTPAEIMPKYRVLPYPSSISLASIPFFVFPAVLFISFFASLSLILKQKIRSKSSYGMFLLSLIGIFFMNQVRVRSDDAHLIPAALVSMCIVPSLFYFLLPPSLSGCAKAIPPKQALSRSRLIPKTGKVMAYTLLITVGICFVRPLYAKSLSLNTNYFSLPDRHPVAKAGYSNMSQDLQDLVLFIQSRTTDNEAIYVGVKNHDRFITNSVIVYFLANRKCATKYHELHPGVATTSNVQKEIIGELKDPSVKLVILRLGFQEEQNDSRIDSKVDLLDSYILTNFEMIRTFGSYEVWSRKVLAADHGR